MFEEIPSGKTGRFSQLLNMKIYKAGKGKGLVTLDISPEHLNIDSIVHGGVYASLLDTAMGSAVLSLLDPGEIANTIDLNLFFLKSATCGRITAEGTVTKRGRKVMFASGSIYDENKVLLAEGSGIWYIIQDKKNLEAIR